MRDFLRGCYDLIAKRGLAEVAIKAARLVRREGLAGLRRSFNDLFELSYTRWVRRYDTLSGKDRRLIVCHVERLHYKPLVSVLMPVYDAPAEFLQRAIDSVRQQLYPYWELCIADDASTQPHVRRILEAAAGADTRIRVIFREENGHISAASNTALEMARGEFIALLDHDDELAEHALYHLAVVLNENPELDLLYSDEDKIDVHGRRFGHYFKPDWNLDLLLSQNVVNHLGVFRTCLARAIGGFRSGYEGAQDWDFALRIQDQTKPERIYHLPRILYHWRAIPSSTAVSINAKNYAVGAAKLALSEYWQRHGSTVSIEPIGSGHFITHHPLPDSPPLVSILIPTRNRGDLLRHCIDTLFRRTDYKKFEVLVIDNDSDEPDTLEYLEALSAEGKVRVLHFHGVFNFAAINNWAAQHAHGECLCLLNNDVAPISPGWLTEMVVHALRPEIGAVGALLYYPNDTIQHAGVFLDGVAAGHLYQRYPRGFAGYVNRARLVQNLSAVTAACLVVRKQIWDEVEGMDASLFAVAFNDVDFCLRVAARGYRSLWTPRAELYHHESASRGEDESPEKAARFRAEIAHLQARWGNLLGCDPAWNPNLALDGSRIRLADPPRLGKPWVATNA